MQWLIDVIREWLQLYLKGMIVVWKGEVEAIPSGFHLCDGTNGTPDLRDRFVPGAGSSYNPDETGGLYDHQHDFTSDGHRHTLPAGDFLESGTDIAAALSQEIVTGKTDLEPHEPPYFALCYIMWL